MIASNLARGALAGMIGGLAGAWTMNQFQALLSRIEPHRDDQQATPDEADQQNSNLDEAATVKTAEAISTRLLHHRLSRQEKKIAEPIVHYGYGTIMGVAYGTAAEKVPAVTVGWGTVWSTGLWLTGDEIAVPLLGLSRPSMQYPASVHVEALAAHLVYGLILEATRRIVRALV